MKLIQLTSDYEMKPFDCGDDALNGFLLNNAVLYAEYQLATTYLLCDKDAVIGYFCLLNDKISKHEVSKSVWRKLKKRFPHSKHFGSYPAIKIGRFAISLHYRNEGWGSSLMLELKRLLLYEPGHSSFRFLTVDAYPNAVSFYERNGFRVFDPDDVSGKTKPMYFDMKQL